MTEANSTITTTTKTEKATSSFVPRWYNEYRTDHITGLREHCSMLCVPCSQLKKHKEPPDTVESVCTVSSIVTTKTMNSTVTSAEICRSNNSNKNNNNNNNSNNLGIISTPFSPIISSMGVTSSSDSNPSCSKSHITSSSITSIAQTRPTMANTTQSISATMSTTNVTVNSSLSASDGSPPVVA